MDYSYFGHSSAPTNEYTIAGVLEFLQREWSKLDTEKNRWLIEKADMMGRISHLEAENRGHEALKNDLVRRIKMLEYALLQERKRYSGTSNETESPPQFTYSPSIEITPNLITAARAKTHSRRENLKSYLQEIVSLSDIVVVKPSPPFLSNVGVQRVSTTANISSNSETPANLPKSTPSNNNNNNNNNVNANSNISNISNTTTTTTSNGTTSISNNNTNTTTTTNNTNTNNNSNNVNVNTNTNATANANDYNVDVTPSTSSSNSSRSPLPLPNMPYYPTPIPKSLNAENDTDSFEIPDGSESEPFKLDLDTSSLSLPLDTSNLLTNLNSLNETVIFTPSNNHNTSTHSNNLDEFQPPTNTTQKVDSNATQPAAPTPSTSEGEDFQVSEADYKKLMGRMKKGGGFSSDLKDMFSAPPPKSGSKNNGTSNSNNNSNNNTTASNTNNNLTQNSTLPTNTNTNTNTSTKKKTGVTNFDSELDQITLEEDILSGISSGVIGASHTWRCKYTLRSHFDGVRSVAWLPSVTSDIPALVSASEDHTLKLWNLTPFGLGNVTGGGSAGKKNTAGVEVEPVYTYRGHTGAVCIVRVNSDATRIVSGGCDQTIRVWSVPPLTMDTYSKHGRGVGYRVSVLDGHNDVVWDVVIHPHQQTHIFSASADRSIKLWDYEKSSPLISSYYSPRADSIPSTCDVLQTNVRQIVGGYDDGNAVIYDIESSKVVMDIKGFSDGTEGGRINKIVSHPTLPLLICTREDRRIDILDTNSGKSVHSMVAHLDGINGLAMEPSGLYFVTGGHDSSVRVWDMSQRVCVQEINSHRSKHHESIHSISFHPTKTFLASGGADSTVKIYQ
eukprot:TRINITY_DN1167_c0_g1_i1.p1 TRINITY_DN1167_c0_g1~~TRINITY_DN1167_c0_g1_i1.p1  ORF type:complete len:843 (-),score=215.12 TRINITY_DN1167_c0_g1_i1:110-2638(-)